ncbi:MAG: hypothetical protein E7213_07600, partial [Clostridium sp.]|nr:hypothetical protein [Clostridium sp.]
MNICKSIKQSNSKWMSFIEKACECKGFTYGEIFYESKRYLGYLQNRGVNEQDEIVILLEDNKDIITSFWSCVMGRFTFVPISNENISNISKILSKVNNPYIISENENIEKILINSNKADEEIIKNRFIHIEDLKKSNIDGEICTLKDDDIVMIQFSSCSNGDFKSVKITSEIFKSNVESMVLDYKKINMKIEDFLKNPSSWLDVSSKYKDNQVLIDDWKFDETLEEMASCIDEESYLKNSNLTETEMNIKEIICEELNLDDMDIDENLYGYGINSLNTLAIKGKIEAEFNKKIDMDKILNLPSIKNISESIDNIKEETVESLTIKNAEKRDYYIASSAEKRMYALQQLDEDNTFYNLPMIFKIEGNISKQKFNNAFSKLVKRHEVLRTYFDVVDGKLVQRISEDYTVNINEVKANITVKEEFKNFVKPFDLNKAPLCRGEIFENNTGKYLLIDIHHIIADGTSINILIDEFEEIYKGNTLDKLEFQYKDYAVWNNKFLGSENYKKQKEFHLNNLNDEIQELKLPLDFKRPNKQSFEGQNVVFDIDEKLTSLIEDISKKTSSTTNMVLLSAFNILLSKLSMQEDIIVGTPVSGRTKAEFQNLIGMFVNTLVLRNKPDGEKSFKDFLMEVKENSLKVYENQDYQFNDLVDDLNIKKDESKNPIFDVVFNYVDSITSKDIELDEFMLKNVPLKSNIAKFDLVLEAFKDKRVIKFNMEYCTKLFKEESIKRFAKSYVKILEEITSNVDVKIKDIEIISDEDKKLIINEF